MLSRQSTSVNINYPGLPSTHHQAWSARFNVRINSQSLPASVARPGQGCMLLILNEIYLLLFYTLSEYQAPRQNF